MEGLSGPGPRRVGPEDLARILAARGAAGRSLTTIAGPPGAGKSTLAGALAGMLDRAGPGSAAVLPMDGYHFDDAVLEARGQRARKGAPHTFDVGGLAAMLARLRANAEAEIAVPVFDRGLEIARAGARIIPARVRHVIVEGNWLLLDAAPWNALRPFFDTTVMLEVPMPEIAARLEARWATMAPEERRRRIEGNDLPNARAVLEGSGPAEFLVPN